MSLAMMVDYYDKNSGAKVDLGTNRHVQVNDNWYYVNAEGKILKGDQIIDGAKVNFNSYNGIKTMGNSLILMVE